MQTAISGYFQRRALHAADFLLLLSFFISGCSALAYQVGWQRALYAHIGVDIDSITLIVSVFMLGIGLGGMLGGWAADRFPRLRLRVYAAIELSIGVYGLVSLWLLPRLVDVFSAVAGHGGALASMAACFLFLLLPTVLMGMTLPLLTMAFDERRGNIGISVGTLYFTNTLGACRGPRKLRGHGVRFARRRDHPRPRGSRSRMNHAALLSFVCGFSSLSLEILWVRLYGYANTSTPAAFGFVLSAYLVGIAVGAHFGARACRGASSDTQLWRGSIIALLLSAVLSVLLPALYAALYSSGVRHPTLDLFMIALGSSVLSFVFPIAHHLGTRHSRERQGRRFATVYTANVMGAALGPLVTGYLLLDMASVQSSFLIVGVLQAAAAIFLVRALHIRQGAAVLVGLGGLLAGTFAVAATTLDPHELVQSFTPAKQRAKIVVENRHGIITVFAGADGDDAVYGGNVYDGRTNLSPEVNTNHLQRPLLMGALHPQPRRVLIVGLSIGTWLAIAREFPGVESVDVVEINPGYLQALQSYPAQASALRDSRVHLAIDDARRWLRRHPDKQYDLVIMNATFHWRSNASLLLSTEFLQLIKGHMAPGAVMTYNATGSGDVFYTATKVFPHAYRYLNFIYAADFDFRERKNTQRTRELYENFRIGGQPFFSPGSKAIQSFMDTPFVTIETVQKPAGQRPFELVTDDNMITEFKYGKRQYSWLDFISL